MNWKFALGCFMLEGPLLYTLGILSYELYKHGGTVNFLLVIALILGAALWFVTTCWLLVQGALEATYPLAERRVKRKAEAAALAKRPHLPEAPLGCIARDK